MLRKMNLRMKMLLGILPIVAIALILVTYISVTRFTSAYQNLTTDKAMQTLKANANSVNVTLEALRNTATVLSNDVGTSYEYTDLDQYEEIFGNDHGSSDDSIPRSLRRQLCPHDGSSGS